MIEFSEDFPPLCGTSCLVPLRIEGLFFEIEFKQSEAHVFKLSGELTMRS